MFIVFISLAVIMTSCATTTPHSETTPPAHHTEKGFRNLYGEQGAKSMGSLRKWQFTRDTVAWTDARVAEIPRTAVDQNKLASPSERGQLTWLGHSTVLFQVGDKAVITDPVFSQRASPVSFAGPKRFTQPALSIEELPSIDIAVISHNHYDHLDRDSVIALGDRVHWVTPLGHREWFANLGITRHTELDWWQSATIEGITVTATPSQHWSARGLLDRFECLWASYFIEAKDVSFWFGGDTGYNPYQFKEIGERFGPIDLAAIPIGAYEPRWFMRNMHVNPAEAAKIFKDIKATRAIGIHWGTFQLTDEGPLAPPQALGEARKTEAIEPSDFEAIPIGATLEAKIQTTP